MKFYHVSTNANLDGMIIHPRLPLNRMKCEERETKRICVSPSINGCLSAVGGFHIGEILEIYVCESDDFIQPDYAKVPDAPLTGETWILTPVKFKHFTRIVVTDVFETSFEGLSNCLYAFELYKS